MSKNKSKDKGVRREREFVNYCKDLGLKCRRVPCSGSLPHERGDAIISHHRDFVVELKSGGSLPTKTLNKWLRKRDLLVLKPDREPWLFVVPQSVFEELLHGLKSAESDAP